MVEVVIYVCKGWLYTLYNNKIYKKVHHYSSVHDIYKVTYIGDKKVVNRDGFKLIKNTGGEIFIDLTGEVIDELPIEVRLKLAFGE